MSGVIVYDSQISQWTARDLFDTLLTVDVTPNRVYVRVSDSPLKNLATAYLTREQAAELIDALQEMMR